MKVRLLIDISGTRNGEAWPARDTVVDLPDAEAVDLLAARIAAPVKADDTVETAAQRQKPRP